MAKKDRLYFDKKFIKYRDKLKPDDLNPVGLGEISRLELFLIAVSMGLDDPKEIEGSKQDLVLLKDLKDIDDKTKFRLILLGKATTNEEIDEAVDLEKNLIESEKCANSGFKKLFEKIEKCSNEELFKDRILSELDVLYKKNVKLN